MAEQKAARSGLQMVAWWDAQMAVPLAALMASQWAAVSVAVSVGPKVAMLAGVLELPLATLMAEASAVRWEDALECVWAEQSVARLAEN